MHSTAHLILSTNQLWTTVIGAIVPVGAYVVNSYLPNVTEPVKAAVHVVLAAVAAALYTALATKVFGLNVATLQLVVTGVVAALAAHHLLWKPATISHKLSGKVLPVGQKVVLNAHE